MISFDEKLARSRTNISLKIIPIFFENEETTENKGDVRKMNFVFVEYPKCSTCQKAKKWLDDHNIKYQDRHIVEQNPTKEELTAWILQSQKPVKSFFNTSGLKYKELKLKDRLPHMSQEEQIELLSTDGMLVKRPLIISEKLILVGFKSEEWEKLL